MKSYWIWNYGDYEIFHTNLVNCRREHYGEFRPPMWKLYDVDRNVKFYKEIDLEKDGSFVLHLNGKGAVCVDGERFLPEKRSKISKGKHKLSIEVFNLDGLPAAFLESDVISTDGSWFTKKVGDDYSYVGFDEAYCTADSNPEIFKFSYERKNPINREPKENGVLFDFGKEIFGFLYIENADKNDKLHVSYGESIEEALDLEWAVIYEDVCGSESYKLRQRGFRYIYITGAKNVNVYAELEYLPLEVKGHFECSDKSVNEIWNMCVYTLMLNTREVFTEAVKRDRWLWGGDAYQIFKFSKYLYFDKDIVRRSLIGLRGKEPFDQHINRITDYSLFWVIGLWEYYYTYKDEDFIKRIYPRAESLMEFCRRRTNEEGFIIGKEDDWIFVDWANMDKSGIVCAEQMLYAAALISMYKLSSVIKKENPEYKTLAAGLVEKINARFWNEKLGAYVDNCLSDTPSVTRHANIFAVLYDIADDRKKKMIVDNVLCNDEISPIATPYFEGYELDSFGMTENKDKIYDKLLSYWKGMLDLGATTVWEEYDPKLCGVDHYKMYGKKFEKSLCHAWGASPIYLLGKYYLGVEETSAGYDSFTVKPYLGKFEYIKGIVPVKDGSVEVFLSKERLTVMTTRSGGTLLWNGKSYTLEPNVVFNLSVN